MLKLNKNKAFFVTFLSALTLLLGACSTRPKLKQLEADVPEQAINTKEKAAALKKLYEK